MSYKNIRVARIPFRGFGLFEREIPFVQGLMWSAAVVLTESKTMPTFKKRPTLGIAGLLSKRLGWSADISQESLQFLVEQLYEAIPIIISWEDMQKFMSKSGAQLIVDALQEYQVLKNTLVRNSHGEYSPDFINANWTDRNKLLRKFFGIER